MKEIKKLLTECENDVSLIFCLCSIFTCYLLVFMVFGTIHWMCALMSPYVCTSLMRVSIKLTNVMEKAVVETDGDDAADDVECYVESESENGSENE